jgi:hypothetical protein
MSDNKFILDVDVKPLKLQLREATQELQKAQQQFGAFSQEAINASQKVAAIKDAMEDAAESAKLFDPGSRFQAITTLASQAAAGVSAFQGAMALVGTESKEVEKTLLKVQGAMALSQGLSELKDVSKSFNQLRISATQAVSSFASSAAIAGTRAAGAVMKTLGIAVNTSSTSFKVLRGAIISTGIGALVVAIGYAVNALMDWYDSTKKQEAATKNLKTADEQLADQIEETNAKIEDRISQLEFSRNKEVILAKARGASLEEIRKIEDKYYNESLTTLEGSYQDKQKAYLGFLEQELIRQGLGQEQISMVLNNYYNKNLVDLNTYYNLMGEEARKQYDLLKKDLEGSEKGKFELNREYSILEANRKLEDFNKSKEQTNKNNQKSNEQAQKLAEARREVDNIIYEGRKSQKDRFEQEIMDIEKKYEEDKKKIAEAKLKDKTKEAEAYALIEKQKTTAIRKVEEEREKERKDKERQQLEQARAFQEELNNIQYETSIIGIKNQYDLELRELNKSYKDKQNAIMQNETYTYIQKFILIASLEKQFQAQKKEIDNAEELRQMEKRATELNEIITNEDAKISVRQAALDKEAEMYEEMHKKKKITDDEYKAFSKDIAKSQKEIDDAKLEQQLAYLDAVSQGFSMLADISAEGTAEWKAMQIAATIINTYAAIAGQLRASTQGPGAAIPGYAIAQAIATGVFGLLQVKKIMETKIPGKDGGGGGGQNGIGGAGGGGSVAAGLIAPNVNATGVNQLRDLNQQAGKPIRAFVVENEMTSVQNRVADIERRSGF